MPKKELPADIQPTVTKRQLAESLKKIGKPKIVPAGKGKGSIARSSRKTKKDIVNI